MIAKNAVVTRLLTALAFLTRLPIRNATCTPEAIGQSAAVFPVVGALVGITEVMVLWIVRRAMPPMLTATVIVLTGTVVTGALHLDGLADMADGFGGGHTRDDVLRIMRDHQVGTYGAIALIVTLLLQVSAMTTLIERDVTGRFLVIAPAVSRWTMVLLGRRLPYARSDAGLGRALTDHVRNREVWASTALVIAIAIVVAGWSGILSLMLALGMTVSVGVACWKRIGGITGDTLGGNAVLCETLIFVVAAGRT